MSITSYDRRFENTTVDSSGKLSSSNTKLIDPTIDDFKTKLHLTSEELEYEFKMPFTVLRKIMNELKIKPAGQLKNIVDGVSCKGVGRKVYTKDVVAKLKRYFTSEMEKLQIEDR